MARLGRAFPGFHFKRWRVQSTGAAGSYNLTAGDTLTSAEANTTRRVLLTRSSTMGTELLTQNQAGFELGTAAGWSNRTNCSVSASTTPTPVEGSYVGTITSSSAGSMWAWIGGGTSGAPAVVGHVYSANGYLQASVQLRQVSLQLEFYDAGGSFITTITGGQVLEVTGAWVRPFVSGVAPATTAYVTLTVYIDSTASGGEIHNFDALSLQSDLVVGYTDLAARATGPVTKSSTDTRVFADASSRYSAVLRPMTDMWNVGTTQRMAPDAVLAATHLAGAYTDIDDDPDSPDGLWLTTDGTPGDVLVSFATPTVRPKQGTDVQEFRVRVRPG